ncbi:MAG TPA: hypothetical protein VNZ67_14765, partial [bacterium]|nr:hypothetical protein [bacterium]
MTVRGAGGTRPAEAVRLPALVRALRLTVAFACAAGCAGAPSGTAAPARTAVSLKLPFVAQAGPHLCGIACIQMLTLCYGHPLKAAALQALSAEAQATGGISGASMKLALENAGYGVAV